MTKVAIVHNIPIHYKHLLFGALAERGLDFTVLFMATRSTGAIVFDSLKPSGEVYDYRIGFTGSYEKAPAATRAEFVWKNLAT